MAGLAQDVNSYGEGLIAAFKAAGLAQVADLVEGNADLIAELQNGSKTRKYLEHPWGWRLKLCFCQLLPLYPMQASEPFSSQSANQSLTFIVFGLSLSISNHQSVAPCVSSSRPNR